MARNIATLYFKTETVAETAFRASWFWSTSARFLGTWGIFSSPRSPKLTFDSFGLQWNAHSKTFWKLTFELRDRNIAPLHFKTERLAETALGASWFWPTSARYSGPWGIFSCPGDAKLTPDGLGLQWNEHSKTFWTLTFGLLTRNIAPLHSKTERVADTTLRKSWFWPTSARFPGSWEIFSSPGDSKLAPDGFCLQSNKHRETFWTLTFKLLARNKTSLHFKTETVSETA